MVYEIYLLLTRCSFYSYMCNNTIGSVKNLKTIKSIDDKDKNLSK